MKYRVTLDHDQDTESPADSDCTWTIHSFSSRHSNFKHPQDIALDIGLRRKLQTGTAFWLSYFEHGQCQWMLASAGKHMYGGDWQWDGAGRAGLLLWEHDVSEMGSKSYEDRAKDAARFLETYTDWCNGNCYYFSIEVWNDTIEDWEDLESCGGFIGYEYMFAEIRERIASHAAKQNAERFWEDDIEIEVTGDCADMGDESDFMPIATAVVK